MGCLCFEFSTTAGAAAISAENLPGPCYRCITIRSSWRLFFARHSQGLALRRRRTAPDFPAAFSRGLSPFVRPEKIRAENYVVFNCHQFTVNLPS